jgi:hypothetical protein
VALGNLVYFSVAVRRPAEALPTTGAFTWVHPAGSANLALSVNGVTTRLPSQRISPPAAFVSAVNGATAGVTATGGGVKQYVTVSGTLAVAVPVRL